MTKLETERLIIRNFKADDWQDLQEMAVKYQASEYAQYDHKWPTDTEEIKDVAEWFAGGDDYLAVCLRATGKLIGFIALKSKEEADGEYSLGYVFNPDHHGQGYATEGCQAILDYAFGSLNAERVVTGTAEANTPSCQLLRRLGMRKMGQHTASFHETPAGEPIEFVALSFALSREDMTHRA
jgi:RimJ/RimL family protein N-acetyltransferase